MPQQTVYIKAEDLSRWRAVKNKAQFIRDALDNAGIKKEPHQ